MVRERLRQCIGGRGESFLQANIPSMPSILNRPAMVATASSAARTFPRYLQHGLDRAFQWLRSKSSKAFHAADLLTLGIVSLLRFGSGRWVASNLRKCNRPRQPLVLYEFESCPFCKKVREALCVLDIDYIVYPCPRETLRSSGVCEKSRFRGDVRNAGGILMFPYIEDPNTDVKMYQSDQIVEYLWREYGHVAVPPMSYRLANWGPLRTIALMLTSILRPMMEMGTLRIPSYRPQKLLELWGFESSPFVKRVREVLSSLELPYKMHVVPIGSVEKRQALEAVHAFRFSWLRRRLGYCKLPLLLDPNTGVTMVESQRIVDYLKHTYKVGEVAGETWLDYGSHSVNSGPSALSPSKMGSGGEAESTSNCSSRGAAGDSCSPSTLLTSSGVSRSPAVSTASDAVESRR